MVRLSEETDIDLLRQAAMLLERENQRLSAKVLELMEQVIDLKRQLAAKRGDPGQLKVQIEKLEQQLAGMRRKLFGASSEKRPTADGDRAQDEAKSEAQDEQEEKKKPRKGHGPRAQPKLPIMEQAHTLADDDARRICMACNGCLEPWEGQFEESEEVDVLERHFVLKKHKRQKYRCRCGGCIETAPAPIKLFPGARYGIDVAIEVVVDKYEDHLPLERQVRRMLREGLTIDSQTLWDMIERTARLLTPGYDALMKYVLSQAVVGADETRWRLMGAKGTDASKSWHVWAAAAPDAVIYTIEDNRGAQAAHGLLEGYSGIVMCDGYSAYKSLVKSHPRLLLAHCWAHVRRKFVDIEAFFPNETQEILELVRKLYAIEARCPAGPSGDAMRSELRQTASRPVIDAIRAWLRGVIALPESGLGNAINYLKNQWRGLTRFLVNPRIPLDNNATERALRGPVVGRKNHYGSRSRRGTEVAALFYSLMESAQIAGIDPKAYLRCAIHAAIRNEPIPLPHQLIDPGVAEVRAAEVTH